MSPEPLFSCILMARSGTRAVLRAVGYFLRQDYGPRELIVVDSGVTTLAEALPADERIRYLEFGSSLPAGDIFELACREARGEIVAHWDDRAWYSPDYLLRLAVAALAADADVCGFAPVLHCDLERREACQVQCLDQHRYAFAAAASCYRRSYWEAHPSLQSQLMELGPTSGVISKGIVALPETAHVVLFGPLPELSGPDRRQPVDLTAIRNMLGCDWRSHQPLEVPACRTLVEAAESSEHLEALSQLDSKPMVSCILRLTNATLGALAIEGFLRQDYQPAELIVVTSGKPPEGVFESGSRIRRVECPAGLAPGAVLNFACEQSKGSFILHWDESWWHSAHHISRTVEALAGSGTDVCSLQPVLACSPGTGQAWTFDGAPEGAFDRSGPLACRRTFWLANRFPEEGANEAAQFRRGAASGQALWITAPPSEVLFVPGEGDRDRFNSPYWHYCPMREVRGICGPDFDRYASAAAFPQSRRTVSCIMISDGWGGRAAGAIACFRQQDYDAKELIVVDDSGELAGEAAVRGANVCYLPLDRKTSVPEQLALACEQAGGELILHWAGAAWHAADRIRRMAAPILAGEADACAAGPVLAFNPQTRDTALRHSFDREQRRFDAASVCYRRQMWPYLLFPETLADGAVTFSGALESAPLAILESPSHVELRPLTAADEDGRESCSPEDIRRWLGAGWRLDEAGAADGLWPPEPVQPRRREVQPAAPMVSCIMPTRDRRSFAAMAIQYFQRQTYNPRELIVVDDGEDAIRDLTVSDPRIRYIRLDTRMSVGNKRNLACERARGEIIAHWDDDDWQSPDRIALEVEALTAGQSDIVGVKRWLLFETLSGRAWSYQDLDEQGLALCGASLCYRRTLWETNRFPNVDLAEAKQFLWNARTSRIAPVVDPGILVLMLHEHNTAPLTPGGPGWSAHDQEDFRRLMGVDWHFYAARVVRSAGTGEEFAATAAPVAPRPQQPGGRPPFRPAAQRLADTSAPPPPARFIQPAVTGPNTGPERLPRDVTVGPRMVSCIMPTHNRRKFLPLAIQYFLRQAYEPKELVIVDDGTDPVEGLVPADDRFRYIRIGSRMPLGAKRNLACTLARGDVILHWDDDDWQAPRRIESMVGELSKQELDVCGSNPLLFWDIKSGLAWTYYYPPEDRFWVAGTSLCYQRRFWQTNPFAEIDVGEDNRFVWNAPAARMAALHDMRLQVAVIHDTNGSIKSTDASFWRPYAAAELQAIVGPDLPYYRFAPPLPKLNLGCGDAHLEGFWNVDRVNPADQIVDLRYPWPWADQSIEFIYARDVIEHLPDKIQTMNEIWRILRPGGAAQIIVPTTEGSGAFQDPTHCSFWNRRSFLYYESGNPHRERFAQSYGIRAAFRTVSESGYSSESGPYLAITLEAVK
jgi:glycosyltransferase involved in cell wall biosynthesis